MTTLAAMQQRIHVYVILAIETVLTIYMAFTFVFALRTIRDHPCFVMRLRHACRITSCRAGRLVDCPSAALSANRNTSRGSRVLASADQRIKHRYFAVALGASIPVPRPGRPPPTVPCAGHTNRSAHRGAPFFLGRSSHASHPASFAAAAASARLVDGARSWSRRRTSDVALARDAAISKPRSGAPWSTSPTIRMPRCASCRGRSTAPP